jgi:glutathione S-transferase
MQVAVAHLVSSRRAAEHPRLTRTRQPDDPSRPDTRRRLVFRLVHPGLDGVRVGGLAREERTIFLSRPDSKAKLAEASPSGRLPVLEIDGLRLWDSLAIAEYLWERHPGCAIWPADRAARAMARGWAGEVHADFHDLRAALPMNLIKRWPIRGGLPSNVKLLARPGATPAIARLEAIWREATARFGGPYLAGASFCFADAMMAMMANRFVTYGVDLAPDSMAFIAASQSSPLMICWIVRAEEHAALIGRDVCAAFP